MGAILVVLYKMDTHYADTNNFHFYPELKCLVLVNVLEITGRNYQYVNYLLSLYLLGF